MQSSYHVNRLDLRYVMVSTWRHASKGSWRVPSNLFSLLSSLTSAMMSSYARDSVRKVLSA